LSETGEPNYAVALPYPRVFALLATVIKRNVRQTAGTGTFPKVIARSSRGIVTCPHKSVARVSLGALTIANEKEIALQF